jgi:hypothetical protein
VCAVQDENFVAIPRDYFKAGQQQGRNDKDMKGIKESSNL